MTKDQTPDVSALRKLVMPNGDTIEIEYPNSIDWAKSWTSRAPDGRTASGEQDWELVENYGLTAILTAALTCATSTPADQGDLVVRVMGWFMRAQGYEHWTNIVGLRHDEQHRVAKSRKPNNERWTVALPLDDAKVSKRDVQRFWNAQPFRLQLLPFEGNCDGCFLKARPKLWEIERTAPGTLQWWSDMENGPGKDHFVTEYSYAELIRDVRRQPDLFAGGLFDDDPEMDAECGTWCAGEAACPPTPTGERNV